MLTEIKGNMSFGSSEKCFILIVKSHVKLILSGLINSKMAALD